MSSLAYLPSSPTLFNSGTRHTQMSSCYLVDSPVDDLDSIYSRYAQVAKLSKFAGGIGIAFSRVRSRGALIRGTNGQSNGIVPFLRTLDSSVAGGQPGRAAQGRGVRLPRAVAPRRRGVPRAARQHRRGRPAHPQPQPRPLGAGRVHAARRGRCRVVADRPRPGPRAPRPVGRGVRRGLPARRGGGSLRPAGEGTRALRPDDAHAGPDRQRLDDLQGRRPTAPATRRGTPPVARSCTCRTSAPRSSRSRPTARPPCATSARSTWPSTSRTVGRGGARRLSRDQPWASTGTSCARPSARPCRCSTASSTSTSTRASRPRRRTRAGDRSASG